MKNRFGFWFWAAILLVALFADLAWCQFVTLPLLGI